MGHQRDLVRFEKYVNRTNTCWMWTGAKAGKGYGRFYLNGSLRSAHRVALALYRGIHAPRDKVVMHSCDVPSCVNPAHLSVGTQSDNMRDASKKGRCVRVQDWRGEKNPKAKLSPQHKQRLIEMVVGGLRYDEVSREFGISSVRVGQIFRDFITNQKESQ